MDTCALELAFGSDGPPNSKVCRRARSCRSEAWWSPSVLCRLAAVRSRMVAKIGRLLLARSAGGGE